MIPAMMNPDCAIDEKASSRLSLTCRSANRLPAVMLSTDKRTSILYQLIASGRKTVYSTWRKIKNTAPFEMTDKYAVTVTGLPSYTSAVHKWNGTAEILNPKPDRIRM